MNACAYVSLMAATPILALNCLLQEEQVNDSDGYLLVLALHSLCFLSTSQTLFAPYSVDPFQISRRHFIRSFAVCSQDSVGMLKSFSEALRMSFNCFFCFLP